MLKKILLRKIKFPLSLRGAKQRSSLKGFSLIELMVALAILGIAALGIFQAYSTGFQAMADSKDRTVATNIAQKKMEEVKNSVFVVYPYYSIGEEELNGKTFTVVVATADYEENLNLKQVYVTVSWENRNGVVKDVQLQTLVYDLETYIEENPDVGRIELSANPTTLTCCVATETSTITAELFTSPPEQMVPSGTPVSFSVISGDGSVDPEFDVTDASGKAYTELTVNNLGPATVQATSGLVDSDPFTVTCIPEADKIDLSADPSSILPEGTSTINAKVTDTCGSIISEEVDVEFTTGKGIFENGLTTITIGTTNGEANVTLSSLVIGDTATVTGTVTLDGGETITASTIVICTNYSISVSAEPTSITPDGSSIITAILTQSGGSVPIGETISFSTDKKGILSDSIANTDGAGKAKVSLSSLVGGDIATITATYNILNNGSISDNITVKCTEYIITITAEPNKIIPGGQSTITATLTHYLGVPASNRLVAFSTDKGTLTDYSVYTNSSGIATTTLTLTLNNLGEVANVSATFGFASDTVSVTCINFVLEVSANPESISPGDSSVITALLKNYSGTPQSGQTITFTTDHGTFVESSTNIATADTNGIGEAVVHLILNTAGTTAIVTAEYDVVQDTVSVECSETYITLNSPSNIDVYGSSNNYVRFDLYLNGGPLTIDKVKINWQISWGGNPSRYYQIWIEQPIGGNQTEIYDNTGWGSHANRNTTETLDTEYTISANRSFRIRIRFISSIRNNHIIFTFNPDDPGAEENYQVEFNTGW